MDHVDAHRCDRCHGILRRSNTRRLCDPCQQTSGHSSSPSPLSAEFYQRPQIATALTAYDFGRFFKSVRAELGLTQEDFGLLTGLAQSRVCKVENGGLRLRDVATIARLASTLDIPAALLGFTSHHSAILETDHGDQAVSWLRRRDFMATATALALGATVVKPSRGDLHRLIHDVLADLPRHLGLVDVERVEATTNVFRGWDNQWGGGLSRTIIMSQLQWVIAAGRHAVIDSEEVGRRLLVATADLAALGAWTSYDLERHDEARGLWLVALDASREAGNVDLVGNIVRQLAHQSLHLGRSDEALRLIRLAHAMTADPDHSASELALSATSAYEGWCHAAMGRVQACERALGRAEDHFTDAGDDTPPWLGHFDEAELTALRGHTYHVLADTVPAAAVKAEPLLQRAVNARSPAYARSKTLNLIALSCVHFQRGDDIERAVAVGRRALAGASALNSPRSVSRLRGLARVTRPYVDHPEVGEFRERLRVALDAIWRNAGRAIRGGPPRGGRSGRPEA